LSGETNLNKLLSSMSPKLKTSTYVFCSIPYESNIDLIALDPLATFKEYEGFTLVVMKETADKAGLRYESCFKCITLNVHSSLEAVGLTAAVASQLARYSISANVMAAFYHDHIFIPADKAELALEALSLI
jgi:hypothetical protein